jgi:hypothetical protein
VRIEGGFMPVALKKILLGSIFIIITSHLQSCATFFEFDEDRDPSALQDENADAGEPCDTGECGARPLRHSDFSQNPRQIRIQQALEARDVVLGMSRSEVLNSWGQPSVREVAGRGDDGHERWRYGGRNTLRDERVVIFENGQVAGWYR